MRNSWRMRHWAIAGGSCYFSAAKSGWQLFVSVCALTGSRQGHETLTWLNCRGNGQEKFWSLYYWFLLNIEKSS